MRHPVSAAASVNDTSKTARRLSANHRKETCWAHPRQDHLHNYCAPVSAILKLCPHSRRNRAKMKCSFILQSSK